MLCDFNNSNNNRLPCQINELATLVFNHRTLFVVLFICACFNNNNYQSLRKMRDDSNNDEAEELAVDVKVMIIFFTNVRM